MQVQSNIKLNFAEGLRSILRQDPDIIMVGEIRDLQTAEIAIQASLTGHLVFSTLHTNDALSAIVRMRDIGVEPYLVASSLMMVQAQRLVRILCPHCRKSRAVRSDDWTILGVDSGRYDEVQAIYYPVGCALCMDSGYLGRMGIFEVNLISNEMREAIHDGKGLPVLRRLASKEGMLNLRQDAARHVLAGTTSVDEALRVTRQESVVVQD